jgi:hypothetical protein
MANAGRLSELGGESVDLTPVLLADRMLARISRTQPLRASLGCRHTARGAREPYSQALVTIGLAGYRAR